MAYVPTVNGKPYPTLVYGDQLSCERGGSALEAMSNAETPRERLEALQPAGQEFHKEMLLLQVIYCISLQDFISVIKLNFLHNVYNKYIYR